MICCNFLGFRLIRRVLGIHGFQFREWIFTRIGVRGGFGFYFRVSVLVPRRLHPIRIRPVAIFSLAAGEASPAPWPPFHRRPGSSVTSLGAARFLPALSPPQQKGPASISDARGITSSVAFLPPTPAGSWPPPRFCLQRPHLRVRQHPWMRGSRPGPMMGGATHAPRTKQRFELPRDNFSEHQR